jgi:hypothetical protein
VRTTGVTVAFPHQFVKASVVELNVEVPQFKVVVVGAVEGFRVEGSKFDGVYEKPTMSTQAEPTHICVEPQATGALHVPLALHVRTPLPRQSLAPGVHTPVQAPETQAEATQAFPAPH